MATPTLPSVPRHDARRFSWSGNHGCAEASDLATDRIAGRLYADACTVGFFAISPRTGAALLFAAQAEDHDADGDLLAIHYRGVDGARDLTVTVFND